MKSARVGVLSIIELKNARWNIDIRYIFIYIYLYICILIQVKKFAALLIPGTLFHSADSAWYNHVFLGMADPRGIALRPFCTRSLFTFIPCRTVNWSTFLHVYDLSQTDRVLGDTSLQDTHYFVAFVKQTS